MDLKKEMEYIENFIGRLTDEEFLSMLEECGNNAILSTQEIQRHFIEEGFYEADFKYVAKSGYQLSRKFQPYEEFDKIDMKYGQGAAA